MYEIFVHNWETKAFMFSMYVACTPRVKEHIQKKDGAVYFVREVLYKEATKNEELSKIILYVCKKNYSI